jgi:thiamine biosynthesis lipoprotein
MERLLCTGFCSLAVLLLLFTGLGGCATGHGVSLQPTASRFEYATVAMGGKARVVVYAADEDAAAEAARAAFAEIERLEQVLSDYRPSSEIRRFQAAAVPGVWQPVSADLLDAIDRAERVSRATSNAFAITVGPAVALWRRAGETGIRPPWDELDAARRLSDPALIETDASGGAARVLADGMKIDFGGIGKGLAADAARRVLRERKITACLVDLGGDLALGDPPPGKRGWSVRIETGLGEHREVALANTCIATSGDAERSVEIGGVRYSHIVDPRTGRALMARRAATVIDPDGATADALASAACVLGPGGIATLREAYPNARITIVEGNQPVRRAPRRPAGYHPTPATDRP